MELSAVGHGHFKRLLRMIALIELGEARSVELLAAELEISRRTAFRDLEVLREAGFDIHWDKKASRYCMRGGATGHVHAGLGPANLFALAVLKELLDAETRSTFARHARAGLHRTLHMACGEEAQVYEAMADAVSISPMVRPDFGDDGSQMGVLQECIAERVLAQIDVRSSPEQPATSELVRPLALRLTSRGWCLVHHMVNGEWRSLLLRDMVQVVRTPVAFAPVAQDAIRDRLEETWDVDCSGALFTIELDVMARGLKQFEAAMQGRPYSTELQSSGKHRVGFKVRGIEELARWLMMQPDVRVREPQALVDCMEALVYQRGMSASSSARGASMLGIAQTRAM